MTRSAQRPATFSGGVVVASIWFALAAASVGHAHMAKSTSSLYSLIAQSDLVIRARVQKLDTFVAVEGTDEIRRSVLRVEVLEVLKGPSVQGQMLPISQHGHGVATYRPGEEALFFLRHLSKSRELQKLASTGELQWYSTQEHDDGYALSPGSRRATLQAARRYVSIQKMPEGKRGEALRKITVKLLASRDPRLGVSALRDLLRNPELPLSLEDDVPVLRKVIHDPQTPIGLRVGLLVEIDRRGLLDPDADWLRLLRSEEGSARLAVIRGSASHPSPALNAELTKLLAGSDTSVASAAAMALGIPGNAAAVQPLGKALSSANKRVSMAAVRGLGAIGTADARAALASAAASHPDPSVRRRAEAELRVLAAHDGHQP